MQLVWWSPSPDILGVTVSLLLFKVYIFRVSYKKKKKVYIFWRFFILFFSVKIQDVQLFSGHLVVSEREDGLPKIIVYGLPDVGEPLKGLKDGKAIEFLDPTYSAYPSESEFSSSILRFFYSSMKTPRSVYDYDMKSGISVLKKIEPVSHINMLPKSTFLLLATEKKKSTSFVLWDMTWILIPLSLLIALQGKWNILKIRNSLIGLF